MMPISPAQSWAIILVVAATTAAIRFLPFWVFHSSTPRVVLYLGKVLPGAVMAMLVVYCLKDLDLLAPDHGLPQILGVAMVALLHKWKHNTLLSIAGGTVFYMLLIQTLFAG